MHDRCEASGFESYHILSSIMHEIMWICNMSRESLHVKKYKNKKDRQG